MSGSTSTNEQQNQESQQQQTQQKAQDETQQQEQGSSQQHPKWACEYCTYENFPLSLKCTMCMAPKPLLNEDIFRLSPTQQLSTTKRSNPHLASDALTTSTSTSTVKPLSLVSPGELEANPAGLWPCSGCTYLNPSQSRRCLQCSTRKEDLIPTGPPASPNGTGPRSAKCSSPIVISDYMRISEQLNAMNLSRSGVPDECNTAPEPSQYSMPAGGPGKRRNNSPSSATAYCSSSTARATDNTDAVDKSGTGGKHGGSSSDICTPPGSTAVSSPVNNGSKWFCSVCTYENWPKSLKCSMCLHPREMAVGGGASDVVGNRSNQQIAAMAKASPEQDEQCSVASSIIVNNKRNQQFVAHVDNVNKADVYQQDRNRRLLRRQPDWDWLNACIGIAENNIGAVETYLDCGGDPSRALTPAEVNLLSQSSCSFDVGHTLIHLAIRFHRDEMLPLLLAQISGSGPGIKRVPSYVAPDLASDIRRHFAQSLRIRKASLNCHYVNEHATFCLPADIEELPLALQDQLYEELLDKDAQKQLEMPPPALNWSLEITERLGSRLMVLWNRSAGDCLLDSVMQATWGVFDRDNMLRRALADTLHQCSHIFYPRWKENELFQAALLHYTLAERQLEEDWNTLLSLASHPGSSLEQLHIFALAHIMRRPIIVYGVKYVKSFRGEDIGYARFEGVYLPLLWEQSFCITSPIALGYTRGHFSALVPTEPYSRIDATRDDREDITFLPLMDSEMKLLPVHFLDNNEIGREGIIMRQWLDVCETEGGLLVAQQKLHKRPLLVAQMLEEWLNHYRRIAISRLF
ncbi:ubiquitin thioesterase trabid-like [Anopheles albimanus]|uniref:ubiquitin thioesterase trabid-like n=1 Tax=Anopheles albimanus TaxID=7167 RepID=UPI00163F9785|nr:ubiquitin thioesterase trabid-like [Anopheles albimanus]